MKKVICQHCNTVNKIKKGAEYFYCNSCGTKEICVANDKSNKSFKLVVLILIILLIIVSLILFYNYAKVKQTNNVIKTSEIKKICSSIEKCVLNKNISNKLFSLFEYEIEGNVFYRGIDEKYEVTVRQFGKSKKYIFKLEDDLPPEIKSNEIILYYSENVNYNEQINVVDYVDGKIDLMSNYVKIDTSNVNINEEGNYWIKVDVKDKNGNINSKKIKTIVKKRKPTKITLNLKKEYYVGNNIVLTATIEPKNTYDKNIIWKVNGKRINGNNFKPTKAMEHEICAESVMDSSIYQCKTITVNKACKSKYVFTLDGGTSAEFYVHKTNDICPGTYRIYISTLDDSYSAYVNIWYPEVNGSRDLEIIDPPNRYGSNSGKKFVLNQGSYIEAEAGITKITLIKN